MAKKLGFISTLEGTPWGGSEELWAQTAERFCKDDCVVGANVKWWPTAVPAVEKLVRAGCIVERRRVRGRLQTLLGQGYRSRKLRWLDRFKPDFVVLSLDYQGAGLDWMQACADRNIPYAVIVESVVEHAWPRDDENLALSRAYASAKAVFFVSQNNLEFVRRQLADPLPNGKVVRNPFNVSYDAAPEWPKPNGSLKLACVGRINPAAKGQDILLEVLQLDKWRQRPVQMTFFGAGEQVRTLLALKEMYGLQNISFEGFTPDVEAIWAKHHLLVLPSRHEGLPLAVVEAMLCGRPCVVTDVAGNAELLDDNVTGFVAAAPKAQFLDEAMQRAWDRREEWPHMGKAAAAQVRRLVPRDPPKVLMEELKGLLR